MARMSIDDKFLRDPRVVLLGRRFGWSRRETMGALIDVFALTYDQEVDVLTADEIDVTAGEAGFADALVAVDLGERDERGVRIKGAAERIEYLAAKREAGRKGGRKSGESRRNRNEAKRSTASTDAQARRNPPDPVPDLPPDPVPVPDRISDLPPARDPALQATEHAGQPERPTPQRRSAVRAQIRSELEAARQRSAKARGVEIRPLLAFDQGIDRDLNDHLALAPTGAALATVVEQARHAIAMAELEVTNGGKSLEWFTGAIFSGGNFRRLASKTADDIEREKARAGPAGSGQNRHRPEPTRPKTNLL